MRKVDGIWYNLDSTNSYGPEIISDFYLCAFVKGVMDNGYSVFAVRGTYPNPN